ncbi:MAG: serine/threonine-protein phosphatase [Spirochaetia bacterium]|nr:serine/threonine-protein phosphatase [Spirochaetia bacterium]
MNILIKIWLNYLHSGTNITFTDKIILKKIKFINSFSLIGMLSTSIFAISNLLSNKITNGTLEILLIILCIINVICFRYTRNYKIAGKNIVFLMYCVLIVLLILGGVNRTGIYWFYTFPLIAFFLLGKRSGLFYTGVLYLITIVLYFLHNKNYIPSFAYSFIEIRQMLASLAAVTSLVYFYEKIREDTESELIQQEKDIWLKDIFDQQFVAAAAIQKSFIPQTINSDFIDIVGYYKPAMEIGGDYFDFFQFDEDRTGIIICDVAGKGIPAALIMTKIRTIIKTMPDLAQIKPGDLLDNLNRFLVNESMDSVFVTALYMIINRKTHTIEFSNAGHFPMTYCSKNKILQDAGGHPALPIGIMIKEDQYRNHELKVSQNDVLVLFTDGFTDMTKKGKYCIGWETVEQIIIENSINPAIEISESLIKELNSVTDNINNMDDISLIIVKIKQ